MPNEIIFDIPTNQYEVHKMPIKQYTQEGYKITDCYVTFLGQEYQMDLQSGFNGFEKDLYQPQVRQELTILPNYQLNFDGIDDYIICPGSMLPIGSSPRTISVWIKPDTFVESHHIFFYGTRSDKHAFALDTDGSGYMQFIVWVDDLSFPVPSDGNWIHVALVYDGNITIKAYTNGNLAGSKTLQGVLTTSTSSLYIGSLDGGTGSFDGLISDIRIYDYQLSEQEIQQTMNIPLTGNEQGLVQYYKLNENEGRIAHDYANNNDGIIVGDPIWVDSDQPLGNLFDYEEIESEDREISFRYIDEQLNEYIYNDTITILNISQRNRYYFLDRLNDLQKTNNINIQHNLR